MPVIINNIKIQINDSDDVAIKKAMKLLKVSKENIKTIGIHKKSLDARKRTNIVFAVSVLSELELDEKALCEKLNSKDIVYKEKNALEISVGDKALQGEILVVGFGPAGIFCGYLLAKMGYKPIIIDRGYDVEARVSEVEGFWHEGKLNPECNVQFGEGGAGTFSDGKLTTRISDTRCEYVLDVLEKFGATKDIKLKAKPHIGTDKLRLVIKNIREEIIALGGEVHFAHKLEKIITKDGKLVGAVVNGKEIETQNMVLAIGHSARDTFSMLLDSGVFIENKSFSVGMRIEHLQSDIDRGLYGNLAGNENLPVGEYQLSYREQNRGVYTFCMCPGGFVVPSSSVAGTVVTNGMSEYNRDQKNANSAVVVSVSADDFGKEPLDGMKFQQELERKAYLQAGSNYSAVASDVKSFLANENKLNIGKVKPSYALGVSAFDKDKLFPKVVNDMLQKGLRNFDRKIKGFASDSAILTGVETRTSSPVRITRKENLNSVFVEGIYPCGEGAGYAGGIMSAAVDGIKVAQQIISTYKTSE